jgi:flagellar basal-body rod protein FlgB
MSMIDMPQVAVLSHFLDLSVERTALINSNLANVDTPGYRTLEVNFRAEFERALTQDPELNGGLPYASFAPVVRRARGLMTRPDGNNVSLEREGLLLAETQLRYNTAVELLRTDFHMLASAIEEGSASS